nr:hypothetical protein [Anaerolineae bacterium]
MHKRALAVGMALAMFLLAVGSPGWAALQPQVQYAITSPTEGMTLSGVVEIRGSANHPSTQWWYNVSYAPGPEPTGDSQWVPLAQVENTPVQDDVLAVWDTTTVPDGVYTLALTVKGQDDPTYWQQFVKNLTVNNAQPVATPTLETPTPEPMPTAVVGPTPTPVSVEQPATPTPRPSPTPREREGEGTPSPIAGADERSGFALDVDALRDAFCDGALITVSLFVLWGLYLLLKATVRWLLRRRTRPFSK